MECDWSCPTKSNHCRDAQTEHVKAAPLEEWEADVSFARHARTETKQSNLIFAIVRFCLYYFVGSFDKLQYNLRPRF